MNVYITCMDCGNRFAFTDSEKRFYLSKGFNAPKRCKTCRTIKNKRQDERLLMKLDYKRSSFFENINTNGGTPVEGGLYIQHRYIFKLQYKTEKCFVRFDFDNKKLFITKDPQQATTFMWSDSLQKEKIMLEKMFPDANVILFPISNYCSIRDSLK